jgi:hypothetical protein
MVLAGQQHPQGDRTWSNRYPYDRAPFCALRRLCLALLADGSPEATTCLLTGAIGTTARYDDGAVYIEEFEGEVEDAQGLRQLCQLLYIEHVMQWQTLTIHRFPFASHCCMPAGADVVRLDAIMQRLPHQVVEGNVQGE